MNNNAMEKTFFVRAEACTGCGICQIACSLVKEGQVNPARARVVIERLVMDGLMLPHICLNCKKPPCLAACRRKAITKDPQTGWVTLDREKCNACTLCIAACPHGAIILTPEKDVLLCDVCGGSPKCAEMCPTGAIRFAERSQGVAVMTEEAARDIFKWSGPAKHSPTPSTDCYVRLSIIGADSYGHSAPSERRHCFSWRAADETFNKRLDSRLRGNDIFSFKGSIRQEGR